MVIRHSCSIFTFFPLPVMCLFIQSLPQTLALYEAGHSTPVGTMDVTVHLTSHGDLLATEFSRQANSQNYDYKSLDEYMPANFECNKVCVIDECQKTCEDNDKQNTSEKGTNRLFTFF